MNKIEDKIISCFIFLNRFNFNNDIIFNIENFSEQSLKISSKNHEDNWTIESKQGIEFFNHNDFILILEKYHISKLLFLKHMEIEITKISNYAHLMISEAKDILGNETIEKSRIKNEILLESIISGQNNLLEDELDKSPKSNKQSLKLLK